MLKIYGCEQCPDCVKCKADLERAGVEYIYLDITQNLLFLKQFLRLRDSSPVFAEMKEAGKIGIPCLLDEKGNVSLSWEEYM